jgi:hypothetical protein
MNGRPKDNDEIAASAGPVPYQVSGNAGRTFANSRPADFGFVNKSAQHLEPLQRVRAWTRTRFALSEQTSIVVAEMACALAGCPPLETVIAFWIDDRRHHLKVFKPVTQVCEEDFPPAWLLPSLAAAGELDCDCC